MGRETEEHKKIKEIVLEVLKSIYGSGLTEYASDGNIHDVNVVTKDGITIFVENVWTAKPANLSHDLNILHRSTAQVKILIVNPKIFENGKLMREYKKTKMSERKKGVAISDAIDGSKILEDQHYVKEEFTKIVKDLLKVANKKEVEEEKPDIFKEVKWEIIETPDKYRFMGVLFYPNIPKFVEIELDKAKLSAIVPSRFFSSYNQYPTTKSYVLESAPAVVDSVPRRRIEIFRMGALKFSFIKDVNKRINFAEGSYVLNSSLQYAQSLYGSISKPKAKQITFTFLMNRTSGKQLSLGIMEDLWLEDYQTCSEDFITTLSSIDVPFDISEVIENFKKEFKLWFKME